ncbi:hypothetical protein D3C87_188440 [compost metagenome]
MNKPLPYKRVLFSIITLIFSLHAFAQLPGFTFNIVETHQTCLGNGALNFSVSDTTPGATMGYEVYLLPNTTTPLFITTNTTVSNLVAGTYTVVATQSLNNETSTNTQNAVINNFIIPLSYTLSFTPAKCGVDGTITVNITGGTGVKYEITSGPVLKPQQTSNVFTGLSAGLYQVRVYDNCGEAVVVSVQVPQATTTMSISAGTVAGSTLPSCNTVPVKNQYFTSPGNIIFFPLTIQYTIFPPGGGAPQIITTFVTSGGQLNDLVTELPFYQDQEYSYNLKITDACGNVYNKNDNVVNEKLTLSMTPVVENCGDNSFSLKPSNYMPPYTLNFTASPAGFDPDALNPDHPTFSSDTATYGGGTVFVPEGNYTVVVTDACNRTYTLNFEINDPEVEPNVSTEALGCTAGEGTISIEIDGRTIVSIEMTSAPAGYPETLPQDVADHITADGFFMGGLILGEYTFVLIDSCDEEHIVEAEIVFNGVTPVLGVSQRQGCELGYGTVKISLPGENLTSIFITAATAAFTEQLPYSGTPYIAEDGSFFMSSLPAGNYTVVTTNSCGVVITQQITIIGYIISANNVEVIPHCGSFALNLQHNSNGNYVAGYYLQKYNEAEGTWEHPATGVDYIEGGQANIINSIALSNNFVNPNLAYTGDFRVIKSFFVYSNGTSVNQRCIQELYTFSFDGGPVITDAYSFPCAGGLTEVAVIAIGVPPLMYEITSKNGAEFLVDNGESNLFSGLETATYNFKVTDDCGNIRNILLDIGDLDPVVIEAEGFCEGEESTLSVAEFTFLTYKWYKQGAPGTVLSTTGTLTFPAYNSVTDSGTYIVSISSANENSCVNQELEYDLGVNTLPNAGANTITPYCNDGIAVNLEDYLDAADTGGAWEEITTTGALTGSTLNTVGLAAGDYQFKYIVTGLCNTMDDAIITLQVKDIPQTPVITANTPICEGDDIQFSTTEVLGATYNWTGPNGFISALQNPLIQNVSVTATGAYLLKVTVNGCPSEAATVAITVNAAPHAGEDDTLSLCNDGSTVDLSDFLSIPHDTGGVWEDINTTGALSDNMFSISDIAAGTYQFKYIVTNSCNATDEAIITINLNDIPQMPLIDGVAPVCEGGDIQFAATAVTDGVYQWSGPNGFVSTQQNPMITGANLAANGTYSLVVIVNGCASPVATVPVVINELPQFKLEGNTLLCDEQVSVLSVVPGNFTDAEVTYTWYYNGVLLSEVINADVEIQETGTYKVVVVDNECEVSNEIIILPNENPFELLVDFGCINYNYMLWVINLSDILGAVVTWTGPNGYSFTGPEADITNLPSGDYYVSVTNSEGCTVTVMIPIDNTSCTIPRGISPNGDDKNDFFNLSNLDVIEIKIFNRYGLQVYESKNYKKEWYGQSDKGHLPSATYYYVITLSAGKKVTGWVYLQREL